MSYFKYTEDILDAIEENRYYAEAEKLIQELKIEQAKKAKLEPEFKRYYLYQKIAYEIIYKINLINDALSYIQNGIIIDFLNTEKMELLENQDFIYEKAFEIKNIINESGYSVTDALPLSDSDKHRMKKSLCDIVSNMVFSFLNDSKYQNPKGIISELDAISYWAESDRNRIENDNPGFFVTYAKTSKDYILRSCRYCNKLTPCECHYCMSCGALIGD